MDGRPNRSLSDDWAVKAALVGAKLWIVMFVLMAILVGVGYLISVVA